MVYVDHVDKHQDCIILYVRSLAKSGINGNVRIVQILNDIYSFTKNGEPVAELIPTGFLVKCCSATTSLGKPYLKEMKKENVC